MTERGAGVIGGTAVLERAVAYLLGSLALVTDDSMSRPTPCRDWTLHELLAHLYDSLAALQEAGALGAVPLDRLSAEAEAWTDPVRALRGRTSGVVGAWTRHRGTDTVTVGGCPVSPDLVAGAGAVEVAVHGWDVAMACGHPRAIPVLLADELFECCHLLVVPEDRPMRFGPPVQVPPWSPAGDRLLGYLGRAV